MTQCSRETECDVYVVHDATGRASNGSDKGYDSSVRGPLHSVVDTDTYSRQRGSCRASSDDDDDAAGRIDDSDNNNDDNDNSSSSSHNNNNNNNVGDGMRRRGGNKLTSLAASRCSSHSSRGSNNSSGDGSGNNNNNNTSSNARPRTGAQRGAAATAATPPSHRYNSPVGTTATAAAAAVTAVTTVATHAPVETVDATSVAAMAVVAAPRVSPARAPRRSDGDAVNESASGTSGECRRPPGGGDNANNNNNKRSSSRDDSVDDVQGRSADVAAAQRRVPTVNDSDRVAEVREAQEAAQGSGSGDGNHKPGCHRSVVDKSNDHVDGADDDADNECCICLEPYTIDNPCFRSTCGHAFHVPCLLAWKNRCNTCPLCNMDTLRGFGDSDVAAPVVSRPDTSADAALARQLQEHYKRQARRARRGTREAAREQARSPTRAAATTTAAAAVTTAASTQPRGTDAAASSVQATMSTLVPVYSPMPRLARSVKTRTGAATARSSNNNNNNTDNASNAMAVHGNERGTRAAVAQRAANGTARAQRRVDEHESHKGACSVM